jgi:HD-like signal output (HDOD) protein
MKQDLATFLSKVSALPSLPTVFYELGKAIDDPYASIDNVAAILRKDQGLASRLLKLTNSALYGFPSRIGTLEEALQLVGMQELRDLALATCVISMFSGLPPKLVNVFKFWQHSVACGVASAVMAEQRHDPLPERFFVGGLLHDVGRLVLFLKAPNESLQILERCQQTEALAVKVENEILGFNHSELGAALLETWSMPLPLVEMVRHHHTPVQSRSAPCEAAVVHFADFLVNTLGIGDGGEFIIEPLSEEGWKRCMVEEQRLEALIKEIDSRYESICHVLTEQQT